MARMIKRYQIYSAFLMILAIFMTVQTGLAKADLLITPLRAVFEGRDRSTVITLINTTNQPKTYRLEWVLLKRLDEGSYEEVERFVDAQGNDLSAAEMIRFSPRQVVLEPQGRQRIRLSLRRPADLASGEYRAHLRVVRLAHTQSMDTPSQGSRVVMNVNVGFSIPVIVREAREMPRITIEQPSFETVSRGRTMQPVLKVGLRNNDSRFSSYGQIIAYRLDANNNKTQIGIVNNVAVYPENDIRQARINLNEGDISNTRIQVDYLGTDEYEGIVFDSRVFNVE